MVDSNAAGARPEALGADEATRVAGRGGLAILVAKVLFIAFGFAQQLVLPRLLGRDGYGQVSLVLSIVSIVNNVIVAASIQGVSRALAKAGPGGGDEALRACLRLHVPIAMVASTAFALSAGAVASFEHAPHVRDPLRVAAIVVLLYGVYAPLVGALNGHRRFLEQALLDIGFGALRMVSILGGAVLFQRAGQSGVLGAFVGFAAAALVIVPVAASRTGFGRVPSLQKASLRAAVEPREYLLFLLPLIGGQVFLNLLMQTDSLLLRRFSGEASASPLLADELQGVYRGVQLFAFLPYQLLMSVTFILFPLLARAQAEDDRSAVRAYAMQGVRLALLLTVLMTGTVAGIAPHLLHTVFPHDPAFWQQGGPALRILALGMGAFAVLGILCAALNSLGRASSAFGVTLLAVLLVAAGCSVVVPRTPFGPGMLVASALATSISLAAATVAAGALVARAAGGVVSPVTVLRVSLALAVVVGVGRHLPWAGPVGTLAEAGALATVGLFVLVVLGEVGREDVDRLRRVAGRS